MFLMTRIRVRLDELAKALTVWLTVAGQKRPALLRDLWTRKDETPDDARRRFARRELGRYLAEKIEVSKWEVTRRATADDALAQRVAADRSEEQSLPKD